MNNKKSPDGNRSKINSTRRLYSKVVRRSTIDRHLKFLFIFNCILVLLFGSLSWVNANLRHDLNATKIHIEEVLAENAQLQEEMALIQVEKDEIQANYEALVTLINNEEPMEREICSTSTFKSWMDYRSITSKSSKQYHLQQEAITDKNFGFRMIDGYLLVAMGPQYGPVGRKYIIQFENGTVINAMIGDVKHQGCTSDDGSMIEFIINKEILPDFIKKSGDFNQIFSGSVVLIREVE